MLEKKYRKKLSLYRRYQRVILIKTNFLMY